MRTLPARLFTALLLSTVGCLLATVVLAGENDGSTNREPHFFSKRPWAVGFGMEGTITNVASASGQIHFRVNGRFVLSEFQPESPKPVQIEVHPKGWFSATVTPDSFVAVTSDGRGGSVQNDKGRLLEILKAAAERGTVVKFALLQPKIDFGTNDIGFTLIDAKVWRITDVNLR